MTSPDPTPYRTPATGGPTAPWGVDPETGRPYAGRSRVTAGLLQLLGLVGVLGIGRIYAGHTTLGIVQLAVGLLTFGIVAVVWGIVDAVLFLTGKVTDPNGLPLRREL